ncbi:hypothetical protein CR513_23019, partial [Mucuna pruriens]
MKHPTEDHSLFINIIDNLVESGLKTWSVPIVQKLRIADIKRPVQVATIVKAESDSSNQFRKLMKVESDSNIQEEVETNSNNQEEAKTDSNNKDEAKTDSNNLEEAETNSKNQPKAISDFGKPECKQAEAVFNSGQSIPHSDRVGQPSPTSANKFSPPHSPPTELKPLPDDLKYA